MEQDLNHNASANEPSSSTSSGAAAAASIDFNVVSIPIENPTSSASIFAFPFMVPIGNHSVKWDPHSMSNETPPTDTAVRRINVEINDCLKDPVEGIHIALDDDNVTIVHALIVGPKDTPYENGFFYFFLRIPPNYPWEPPKVKLMTTGGGTVRFNPNLYNCGKVCLSILGTWPGPSWTAALSIKSVLLSIQSIMNKEPFFNEPGYDGQENFLKYKEMSEKYTEHVRYETFRVAVLGMMESLIPTSTTSDGCHMPQILKKKMKSLFKENLNSYISVISNNLDSTAYDYKSLHAKFTKFAEWKKSSKERKSKTSKK